jgi:hypothetical protein
VLCSEFITKVISEIFWMHLTLKDSASVERIHNPIGQKGITGSLRSRQGKSCRESERYPVLSTEFGIIFKR